MLKDDIYKNRGKNIKKYKIGFDIWGLFLFLIIMCPNFIWFLVPAPNDILRADSITINIDRIAQIFQIIMFFSLCFFINIESQKTINKKIKLLMILFCVFYFSGWILYYIGIANKIIILDLCIAPCIVFILFAGIRKNIAALISTGIFMICHLIYTIVNFII